MKTINKNVPWLQQFGEVVVVSDNKIARNLFLDRNPWARISDNVVLAYCTRLDPTRESVIRRRWPEYVMAMKDTHSHWTIFYMMPIDNM